MHVHAMTTMYTTKGRFHYEGRDIRICPQRVGSGWVFAVMMDDEILDIEPPLPTQHAALEYAKTLIDDEGKY